MLDYEQGDLERILEVDGGELGRCRPDERQVAPLHRETSGKASP
jgi:hypothetical protein